MVCGAHDCHASIAPSADDHGQWTLKYVALAGIGWVLNVNSVTTPKLPPPPPFSAHSRSASVWCVDRAQLAVRGDDLDAEHAVDREPEVAAGQPEATAERHARDPHRRARPPGNA